MEMATAEDSNSEIWEQNSHKLLNTVLGETARYQKITYSLGSSKYLIACKSRDCLMERQSFQELLWASI